MAQSRRLRAFIALRLNAQTLTAIASFVQALQEDGAGVGWVKRDNLHVTLRFLGGAVAAEQIARLAPTLAQIGAATPPFELDARGTGAFPNLERPRAVWIGLRSDALAPLAARVESAARECGFPPEPRPYAPHLTIGRVRNLHGWALLWRGLVDAADREFGRSRVDSILLYRSILGGAAPIYEELARYPLGVSV
ncbi:MAG: RNA 2',3'-cyclic phosphodiesterase [Candidatus Binataceae bacterium]